MATDTFKFLAAGARGPLSSMPEFRQAFRCPAEAPMVRPDGKRCEVW